MEKNYEFRQELLQWHRPDLRCPEYSPEPGMVEITEDFCIMIPADCGEVLLTAAKDFQDYLFTSMGCGVPLRKAADLTRLPEHCILVATADRLGNAWTQEPVAASYEITVESHRIAVRGIDERGCAQGCYALEDRMNRIRAPYLTPGVTFHAPAFSPRMIHSGYGQEQYPEQHLSAIAHAGMDAILYFVKDVDRTDIGYQDFNNTIRIAAKYGLDVYAYIRIECNMHPDEPGADAYYHQLYGRLFEHCPGFKGVVLVGESVEFPSKDPRVSPFKYYNNTIDGLPTGKPTPGWFPCFDYPKWLAMLQKAIYPYKPDADIVLWTYNWGKCAEADRLALIDNLPEGITLMATFEMFQTREMDGFRANAVDYTISFPEAGPYFISEAKRAKERGIRLYTQANSAGLTWDYGVIPYDPFPGMWVRRYRSMLEARETYGLCGVMESHHYGFWPSFISKIEKMMFTLPSVSGEDAIKAAAQELYGPENADAALEAWQLLSQAHTYYPCTNADQYGPFRIGPAYPFVLGGAVSIPTVPHAIHGGNRITYPDYARSVAVSSTDFASMQTGFRHCKTDGEIRSLEKMRTLLTAGREKMEQLTQKLTGIRRADCLRLCNMIHFMENTATTVIHAKHWAKLRWQFPTLTDPDDLTRWTEDMLALAKAELANAENTIPLVEADSRLGWEPSMEYIGDARHIRWKIRQLTQVIENELPCYPKVIGKLEEIYKK